MSNNREKQEDNSNTDKINLSLQVIQRERNITKTYGPYSNTPTQRRLKDIGDGDTRVAFAQNNMAPPIN